MKIPHELKQAALSAHRDGIGWNDFLKDHAPKIRQAEPYNQQRFHRLVELVRCVVVSGTTSGMFAIGDDDATCEWFEDDLQQSTGDAGCNL